MACIWRLTNVIASGKTNRPPKPSNMPASGKIQKMDVKARAPNAAANARKPAMIGPATHQKLCQVWSAETLSALEYMSMHNH